MTREDEPKPNPIPRFNGIEEAAAFWDTHSPLDYPENFREVKVRFTRPLIRRRHPRADEPPAPPS